MVCESTRTKSPEGGTWILCPSTVVAKKAAGALLTARLAEEGKMPWIVEVPSTKSPFGCRAADMPDPNVVLFPRAIVCESTRTKSPEGGTWILCPSTVVVRKAAGVLWIAGLAERGKNLWTVEVPSTKSPFGCRAADMPDPNVVLFPRAIVCESTRTKSPEGGTWILCPLTVVVRKAARVLWIAGLAERGKNLWTVEVPSTKSPFECRATDMPDPNVVLFPRAIVCASTKTTSADSGTWILCPSTEVTDKTSRSLLTGEKAGGSGEGRVWVWPSAISIKAAGAEDIWCPCRYIPDIPASSFGLAVKTALGLITV